VEAWFLVECLEVGPFFEGNSALITAQISEILSIVSALYVFRKFEFGTCSGSNESGVIPGPRSCSPSAKDSPVILSRLQKHGNDRSVLGGKYHFLNLAFRQQTSVLCRK